MVDATLVEVLEVLHAVRVVHNSRSIGTQSEHLENGLEFAELIHEDVAEFLVLHGHGFVEVPQELDEEILWHGMRPDVGILQRLLVAVEEE